MSRQLSHLFGWGVYTYGRRSPKIGRQEEEKEEEEDSKKAVKYLKTLNGRFVKEGYHFPFFGFPEPWIDASGNRVPGFEIFFTNKVTWELDEGKAKRIYQWEEPGIQRRKAVESEIEEEYQLKLMFTQDGAAGEQGMVSMIIADPVAKDPSTLRIPADEAPRNWSSLPQLKSVSLLCLS